MEQEVVAGRYELEALVGTGGMSSVYRAHDRLLDRKVALKILHAHYSDDPEYVERFRREARAVATLSHPNVVTVIDRGEQDGREFIVFEYVDGDNLKRLIERPEALSVERALELAIQVARGLAVAHREGLVHRDVKPQNVLLNGDGQAKVTDFGIARALDVQRGVTQTGTVLGTSDYIAPEQAQGRRAEEQSDVYSLGVVLYELLTKQVPFPGENFVAVAMRHINEPPPSVRDRRADVPPRVDAAIRRAMAKEPADRFASMAEFGRELEACLAELRAGAADEGTQVLRPQSPPARRRRRRRMSPWPVVLAVSGVLVIGVAVYVLIHGPGINRLERHVPGHSSGNAATSTKTPVELKAIRAYDPDGDGHENDGEVGLATDGKAGTSWSTERYYDAPSLNKPGVGLVLDAGAPVTLHRIAVTTPTPGFTAKILAGDASSGPFQATMSASQQVQGPGTPFTIDSSDRHRYWVIWITELGTGFQNARIAGVTAG
jgi:serine/threonine-protein kinase